MKKSLYYTLNFTWGALMNVAGLFCAVALLCVGRKANTYHGCLHVTVGKNWGGVSLGVVIITDAEPTEHTLKHEYGHTIQNAILGPLFPFLVGVPSVLRYWKWTILEAKGVELEPYDAAWYEGQATALGEKFIRS